MDLLDAPWRDLPYWSEDPDHPVADWQYEVANATTREGYWVWVENQRTMARDIERVERLENRMDLKD